MTLRRPHDPSRAARRGTGPALLLSLVVTLAIVVSGCAAETPAAAPDAADTARTTAAGATAQASASRPDKQDVTFATMMIAHHGQAVWMSKALLAKRGIPERVAAVARYIQSDQQREIDEMNRWLAAWKKPTVEQDDPEAAKLHGAGHGMLSKAQLSALAAAGDGAPVTRLYLRGMIEHHEGAVNMARAVLKVGENVYIRNLAKHIINEQSGEITAMTGLLSNPA